MTTGTIAALAALARRRHADFDGELAAWRIGDGAGVRLWCAPGCGNCCTLAVNATLPEALVVAESLDAAQMRRLAETVQKIFAHAQGCTTARSFLSGYKQAVGPCPFLGAEANCGSYAVRPLACRALLSTRPPDWCGINLAELPSIDRDTFLAALDRAVVAYPTHYAAAPQDLAAAFERGLLLAMIHTVGFGVSGNLPLLAWLSFQTGFTDALTGGPAAFKAFLAGHHADRPFLAQIATPEG